MHNQYSQELMQIQKYKTELLEYNEQLTSLKNKLNEYEFIKISMENLLKENQKLEEEIKVNGYFLYF